MREHHRRSESLDTRISGHHFSPLSNHKRNYSMEPQELLNDFAVAVEGLNLISKQSDDVTHDYAEIYTPSVEKTPIWMKTLPGGINSSPSSLSNTDFATKPPTPPLHRFPSWEAKIYEVANDGLAAAAGDDSDSQDQISNTNIDSPRLQAVLGGYCDINVPVYATVKGVSIQFLN